MHLGVTYVGEIGDRSGRRDLSDDDELSDSGGAEGRSDEGEVLELHREGNVGITRV